MKRTLPILGAAFYGLLIVFGVLVLPGCGALIDWGKDAVNQGREKEISLRTARQYIRSASVYDQFTLLGSFDALWLSDSVRVTFARMYALKWGKSQTQAEAFVARQREENGQYISFYVLYPFDKTPLGMIDSPWSTFLQIDGKNERVYAPLEIRAIELSPEYQKIYGPVATRFKQAYQINFDAKDRDDNPLITHKTRQVSLCFRSVVKEVTLSWYIHDGVSIPHKGQGDRLVRPRFDTEITQGARDKRTHEKNGNKIYAHGRGKKRRHTCVAANVSAVPASDNSVVVWRKNKKNSEIEELV